ncbi:hypothetical protein [Gelidibacter sp.]|uniref:hypothetical protein n=1 Tax=Gelidibacter sp. TaxID=2018083 RepID=UPI0032655BDE
MTYKEQLESSNWKRKRQEILVRDGHKCQHCSNKKLLEEMDDGLFRRDLFPNDKCGIDTYNFGENEFNRTGIDFRYTDLIKENVVLYSIKVPNWKTIIVGVRNFNEMENRVFLFYENKRNLLKKDPEIYNLENVANYVTLDLKIEEEKRQAFIKLKKTNDPLEFDWKLMLGLHIHHKYYVEGLKAWEYPNDALVALCHYCHEELHRNEKVPLHGKDYKFLGYYYSNCLRCNGKGYLSRYHYHRNGICFRCQGAKYEELIN